MLQARGNNARTIFSTRNIFFLITGILVLFEVIRTIAGGGEMLLYVGVAQLMREGKDIYFQWVFVTPGVTEEYSYSPFFAFILIPFTYLPGKLDVFLWLMLNLFFIYRIVKILAFYLETDRLAAKSRWLILIFTLVFTLRFALDNFDQGQMTFFLLYCSLESIFLFHHHRWLAGSILLALSISIKLLPLALLPYLLYRAFYKEAFLSIFFIMVFTFLPAVFVGYDREVALLKDWWRVIHPSGFLTGENKLNEMQSLSGFIPALFSSENQKYMMKRNILELNMGQINLVLNAVRLLFICLTLFFLRTFPFKKISSKIHILWELSYIFLITPLIFPHQQKYAFVFITPAIAYLLYYLVAHKDRKLKPGSRNGVIIIFFVLSFLLLNITSDGIIGRHFSDITEYFKAITIGTMLLIIPLYLAKPDSLHP